MKCSVIVATYTTGRLEELRKCLKSLQKQTTLPDEVLLILDPFRELIDFYSNELNGEEVKIVVSEGFGLSSARNTGIKASTCEVLVFIDDDAYAQENWLEKILENFRDEKVWVVGGKIIPEFEIKRPRWFPEELNWIIGCTYKGMPDNKTEIRNPIGANMAFRREVFEKVGFFETSVGRIGKKLLGSEETELCLRLKKECPNARIIYDPGAVVFHRIPKERMKISYVLRRAYYEGVSKAILSSRFKIKTEKSYLRFLLKSIGRYLVRLDTDKCFIIILVILSTTIGFLVQKVMMKIESLLRKS